MRQIGTISQKEDVDRFVAFLATQGIAVHVEQAAEQWYIWGRDEDQLSVARKELAAFDAEPTNTRYDDALAEQREELAAQQAKEAAAAERQRAPQRTIHRRTPLVSAVMILCLIVFVLSGFGRGPTSPAQRALGFCDTKQLSGWKPTTTADRLVDISRGQVWRTITPIFLHGDAIHLLFNMFMFSFFGSMIEHRRGAWRLLLLIIIVAVISNFAQGLAPADWGPMSGGPFFVGISGVVYGLFAYVWLKTLYESDSGYYLAPGVAIILVVFMTLGFTGWMDASMPAADAPSARIANVAHVVGLASGLVIAATPLLWRRFVSRIENA